MERIEIAGTCEPCPKCGRPTRVVIRSAGAESLAPVACACAEEEWEAFSAKCERASIARLAEARRRASFVGADLSACTFEASDGKNPELTSALYSVCQRGVGAIVHGPRGTGKTYAAAACVNMAVSRGRRAVMGTATEIANAVFSSRDKNAEMGRICGCDLLVLDDYGAQRATDYMREQVFEIVDACYRYRTPMIVTTNLTVRQMAQADPRVFERLFERCERIEASGANRRLS